MHISSTLKKFALTFLLLEFSHAHLLKKCKIDHIYSVGDSNSDTGNSAYEIGLNNVCALPPYGVSYFNRPTGRCSDGLLIIDFIALDAGVPLLPPYLNKDADFTQGANFAVVGATALPASVLAAENVTTMVTNSSLFVQLDWMDAHFNFICHYNKDCDEIIQNALIMLGTIGGLDYGFALLEGKTIEVSRSIVRQVVNVTILGARRVITYGATRIVIPGNFPIGCLPVYKTVFATNISAAYDENQCLKQLNGIAKYHNKLLQQAIHHLQQQNPNVTLLYGDYYNGYEFLHRYAKSHGFDTERACCGIGGKYNVNVTRFCGSAGVPVCPNPDRYVSWDGIHMTHVGYKIITEWLLHDISTKLHCH